MKTPPSITNSLVAVPRAEISVVDLDVPDAAAALSALAERAEAAGFVRPSFRSALLTRERQHPTGLPTSIPVAIPHADTEHVLVPALGLARLTHPVDFQEMGGGDSHVAVSFIVLILMTEPHEQVPLLSRLITLFQQDDWYDGLAQATSAEELVSVFSKLLETATS